MLKRLVSFGLLLSLASGLAADTPLRRAMVLTVQGEVVANSRPVKVGQLLDDSSELDLKGRSTITLLLLSKGQRLAVDGQGKVQVREAGVLARDGATVRLLDSNQRKITLNGENHRAIGGMTTREVLVGSRDLASTSFDKVEVRPGKGLLISRPAGSGTPPKLSFHYTATYRLPDLTAKGATCLLPSKDERVSSSVVAGEKVGSRWQWRVEWPKADYKSMGLTVTEEDDDTDPLLYTWVYQTAPRDEAELLSLAKAVEDWRGREPESLEPLVLYSSLLEDRGYLELAGQQLDRALALKREEPGLLEMKARVLTELGRYAEAAALGR